MYVIPHSVNGPGLFMTVVSLMCFYKFSFTSRAMHSTIKVSRKKNQISTLLGTQVYMDIIKICPLTEWYSTKVFFQRPPHPHTQLLISFPQPPVDPVRTSGSYPYPLGSQPSVGQILEPPMESRLLTVTRNGLKEMCEKSWVKAFSL